MRCLLPTIIKTYMYVSRTQTKTHTVKVWGTSLYRDEQPLALANESTHRIITRIYWTFYIENEAVICSTNNMYWIENRTSNKPAFMIRLWTLRQYTLETDMSTNLLKNKKSTIVHLVYTGANDKKKKDEEKKMIQKNLPTVYYNWFIDALWSLIEIF